MPPTSIPMDNSSSARRKHSGSELGWRPLSPTWRTSSLFWARWLQLEGRVGWLSPGLQATRQEGWSYPEQTLYLKVPEFRSLTSRNCTCAFSLLFLSVDFSFRSALRIKFNSLVRNQLERCRISSITPAVVLPVYVLFLDKGLRDSVKPREKPRFLLNTTPPLLV
jgi:hypothetical protein